MSSRESIQVAVAAAFVATIVACRTADAPKAWHGASAEVGERASSTGVEHRTREALDPSTAWAGQYAGHFGVDSNESLELTPDARFALHTEGLHAGPRSLGRWRLDGDLIRFDFASDAPAAGDWFYAKGLVPVRWGDRRYLLRPSELPAFCNSVNNGTESAHRSRSFFVDHGECRVSGLPELPTEFAERLRAAPLTTRVARVIDEPVPDEEPSRSGWTRTRVQLDAGSRDGLRTWTELFVVEPEMSGWVELARIDDESSEAIIRFESRDGSTPWKGAILSTRPKPQDPRRAQNSN